MAAAAATAAVHPASPGQGSSKQHDAGIPFTKPRFTVDESGELKLIPNPARSLGHMRSLVESRDLVLERVRGGESPYWAPLVARLTDAGVEVIDLTSPLLEAASERGLDTLFRSLHYGPEGNAVVAETLLDSLVGPRR